MNGDYRPPASLFILALVFGVGGAAASIVAWVLVPGSFYPAWLAAFDFWLGVPLGALALLMVHDLSGGRWGVIVRPPLEAAVATLPLFVVVFAPVLVGLFNHELFSWMREEEAATLPNTFYLNWPFFVGRAVLYFVVWGLLGFLELTRRIAPDEELVRQPGWISGVGLILLAYTGTFSAVDWVMSIEPRWSSTMFGMAYMSGEVLLALAVVTLVVLHGRSAARSVEGDLRDRFNDLGALLLGIVLFWIYAEFMQFLIIWEENLRKEIPWYVVRFSGGWDIVALVIVAFHFVIPFFILIWRPLRRSRVGLGAACWIFVAIHLVYVWWLVLPSFGRAFGWVDAAAACAVGGLAFALFLYRLAYGRLLPVRRWVTAEEASRA